MTGFVLREALPGDVPAIVALLADDDLGASRETGADPKAYAAAFAAIDRDPNNALYVLEQGGRLIGCFQLTFIPGLSNKGAWRGQIESVRIASDLRGHGHGARLIKTAIQMCQARGCRTVQLSTHKQRTKAHRFYERLGFVASHEGMKLALP
ncbi:MAG: GNAT family N-acetyltransferase [Proteobacteria bacterium]|nr:GNAT family N-acetyltransferase [Pseudomonadota bacterium]